MNRRFKEILLVILDAIFINTSILIGYILRFDWSIPGHEIAPYIKTFIPITLIMIITFYAFKLYKSIWRYASVDELLYVIIATTMGSLFCYVFGVAVKLALPRSVYLMMWAFLIISSGGIRFFRRLISSIEMLPRDVIKNSERTLIYGAGDAGSMVVKEMKKHPEGGYIPVGFIDDDKSKIGKYIHGIPIIGTRENLKEIAKDKDIDEILIALPSATKEEKSEILNACSATNVKLKTLPGIYEFIDGDLSVKQIRNVEIEDLLGRDPIELNIDDIAGYLSGKVVMVTGGGGSIGSELCRQIARFNPKLLVILDIYENNAYDLQMELDYRHPELKKEVVIASIRDKKRLEEVFDKYRPDVVFHAAAHKHVPLMEMNPKEAIKNNVVGTLNLVECADKYHTKKLVQISTDKAVNPTNIMGATKRMCEMIIQAIDKVSNTEFVAVRFGNVLGSNGSVIPLFKKQIKNGGPVTVTHPEITRYFMTIPEAAQLVIQAGAMAKGGEIFVLDMGKPVKIVDLARDLIRLSGFDPDKDIKIEFTGLRPGEKLYEELLMNEEGLQKTAHKKIFIGKPGDYDFNKLKDNIRNLSETLDKSDDDVFNKMEELVPTYKGK